MRTKLVALFSFLTFAISATHGGPETGKPLRMREGVAANSSKIFKVTLKGRERTLVTAWGDENAALGLYLFDEEGNCLARADRGVGANRSKQGLEWFPRETQTYLVEVRNLGPLPTRLTLVVR